MGSLMRDVARAPPTLDTLPSELRKLIVSFMVPAHLRPHSKQALKNANLAHRCLREWVTEYLFQDMALLHVVPGMASHLEYFATHPEAVGFLKYVKRVVVQVPPALRWEVGNDGPIFSRQALTMERLYSSLKVQSAEEMTTHQRLYCQQYHRNLVEPFTTNQRWMQLLVSAGHTWGLILSSFRNLETVEVDSCGRTDHPWSTSTHRFLQQYGRATVSKENPAYIEDDTINKGWASLLLAQIPCDGVRTYHLTWAQTDNLNSFATVNRLLVMGYDLALPTPNNMTRLTLTLEGVCGTHGSRDWQGKTGTAGGVRFWQKALNKMQRLSHLTLCNQLSLDEKRMFTDLDMTDVKGNVVDWFLPGLSTKSLRTLRLEHFAFRTSTVAHTFRDLYLLLDTLILDDCSLMELTEEAEGAELDQALLHHIQGHSWVGLCQNLTKFRPERRISLIRPISTIHGSKGFRPNAKVVEQLVSCHGVSLDLDRYPTWANSPPDHIPLV